MRNYIFKNYGGSYQLSIETPEDLKKVIDLDEALWAATSIPVEILNTDAKFLSYLDTDKNGRIRTDEIKTAIRWLFSVLKSCSRLAENTDTLMLEDINTDNAEGRVLQETAGIVLSNLDASHADRITLSQVRDVQGIMSSSATNGDGVITAEDTDDKELAEFIRTIMKTMGVTPDASGKDGISSAHMNEFFAEARLYLDWMQKGKIPEGETRTDIMVWGKNKTEKAFAIIRELEQKIAEFFALCAMYRFDIKVKEYLNLSPKELEDMDLTDKEVILARLKKAPLADVNNKSVLPLCGEINVLYSDKIKELKEDILVKVYGEEIKELTQKEWERVKKTFSSYRSYLESKKGSKVENLSEEELLKYTSGDFRKKIDALIQKDLDVAEKIKHVQDVEKLILFQKLLMEFVNNSASFANVYNPEVRSLFEAGTLVIDGRKMTLALITSNRVLHKKIAEDSNVYLMYIEVTGKNGQNKKFDIVAAVTSGDSGALRIGKRGIFFTRDGKEWDAEVVDIVVNPIGIIESIKAPFIKLSDMIKKHVEKFAKTREAKIETAMLSPSGASITRDLLVGGGVAIAALGSSFAYITKAMSQVKLIHVATTLGLIIIAVLLPSLIIGIMKLRRRNLSIIFEASGCAINVRMKMTVNLGRIFTFIPPYPAGSKKKGLDLLPKFVEQIRLSRQRSLLKLLAAILLAEIIIFITWLTRY